MKMLFVLLAAVTALGPSTILAHAGKYNGKSVFVRGTARDVIRVGSGQSVFTRLLLCDTECLVAFTPGPPAVSNGQTTEVNGTFYLEYEHGLVFGRNIVVGNGL